MARTARAAWRGTLKDGDGTMALGSGAFEGPYSFQSRFEEGQGTNPEELIGAALAGCFSMALGGALERQGNPAESIETEAKVHLRRDDSGARIARIDLVTRGRVAGVDEEAFKAAAEETKQTCIVARALGAVEEITVEATLES